MACIIKIKGKENWMTFTSEDEARKWLADNHVTQEGNSIEVSTRQEAALRIIMEASASSWEQTRQALERMRNGNGPVDDSEVENSITTQTGDFDYETYSKASESVSLGDILKEVRVPDPTDPNAEKRLFPEFITSNWLNVETENALIRALQAKRVNISATTAEDFEKLRNTLFDRNMPAAWVNDGKLHTAQEWYNLIKESYPQLTDQDLNDIDETVNQKHNDAFEDMLTGEVMHKIFETIIKHPGYSKDKIKQEVDKIFATFAGKYPNGYEEIADTKAIIDKVETKLNGNYDNYYAAALDAIRSIKTQFSRNGAHVELRAEQRITCDLDFDMNGKSKIRGKIDIIAVVDGVPHIIDLKVSKNEYNDWNSAKKLKTLYTMGMYQRMLGKIGLNTHNSSVYIFNFKFDNAYEKIESKALVPIGAEIVSNFNLQRNLNTIFTHIKQVTTADRAIFSRVTNQLQQLFGTTTAKGRKDMSVQRMEEILKNKVKFSNGKWFLRYHLFDSQTAKDENKYQSFLSKEEAYNAIPQIAQQIISQNEQAFSAKYDTLVADLKEMFANGKAVEDFRSAHDDPDMAHFYGRLFYKYQCTGAEILDYPAAKENGIILIRTDAGIDTLSVSPYDPFSDYDLTDKNKPLFSVGSQSSPLKRTIGNVNITKALLLANEIFKDSNETLNDVIDIQLGQPVGHQVRVADMKYIIDSTTAILHEPNNITAKFTDPLTKALHHWNCYCMWRNNMSSKKGQPIQYSNLDDLSNNTGINADRLTEVFTNGNIDTIRQFVRDFTGTERQNIGRNLAILNYLRDTLQREYYTEFTSPTEVTTSPEACLMAAIMKATQVYLGNEVSDEVSLNRYALGSGTYLNSLDTIPNENVAVIRNILNASFDKIGRNFNKFNSRNRVLIQKLMESKGYSSMRKLALGDLIALYDNLYREQTGESPNLILKDPWSDNSLTAAEREYIKFALFNLNKRKYHWKTEADMQLGQLRDVDFNVPLLRADAIQKFRNSDNKAKMLNFRSQFEAMKMKLTSARDIFEEQVKERKSAADRFEKFYNPYDVRTNNDIRRDTIERLGIESFSTDLETIMDYYVLADESQDEFDNNLIPQVRSILYVSSFGEKITGKDQEKFKEYVTKLIKNTVYGESIMDPEVQKYMRMFVPLRSAAFFIGLGFNAMNVPREVLMGFFNNIRTASLATYGKETFSVGDYLKAFGIMTGDIPGFVKNVTKIELLNEFYRMSNMSITEIPEQVKTNKTGIFATFTRFMSWSLTAPDYWNRMSMFIAQMIHDGTWDAHTVVTNPDGSKELKYNINKDRRFNIFTRYKGDIKRVPNSDLEKFNYQRALYKVMREEMEKDNPELFEDASNTYLPMAYTNRQHNSMKSFADTSFGYYDNETKALFFKTAVGQIFKQFMAYMTGKKVQYYQTGSTQTARGSFEQLTDISGDKLWRIIDNDENIVVKKSSELTTDEKKDAEPILGWKGAYIEGILQSYWNLIIQVGANSWKGISGKEPTNWKALWKDYATRGNIRNSNLIQPWIDLMIASWILAIIRMIFFDNPEVTGISYEQQEKQSSALTQNLMRIVTGATQDFDIMQIAKQGLFEWESPSMSIMNNTVRNIFRNMGDDDLNLAEATLCSVGENLAILRPIRPYIYDMKQEFKNN